MVKTGVYFTNDNGQYYIEKVVTYEVENNEYLGVKLTIDETLDVINYKKTKRELSNPTTSDGDVLVVIKRQYK